MAVIVIVLSYLIDQLGHIQQKDDQSSEDSLQQGASLDCQHIESIYT